MKGNFLRVETKAMTRRVILENGRAVGVEYEQNRQIMEARARSEVILSAGSINSVQILQLSGIGPAELLKQYGIKVHLNRNEIGSNLQDHLQLRCAWKLKNAKLSILLQTRSSGKRKLVLSIC